VVVFSTIAGLIYGAAFGAPPPTLSPGG
jgi:hypothetical protein